MPARVVPVPTTAIVTDDWIAWAVAGLRRDAGLGILYDTEPITKAARLLRNGEALLVLGEYAKESMRTHPVHLLDGVAELPAGAAALARLCGSPIVPFTVLPLAPRRWRVTVEPPLLAPSRNGGVEAEMALLQELADRWSVTLRENAEHWAAVYPMTWRTS
jgi:lauroyl/myristoyl acyltransferase